MLILLFYCFLFHSLHCVNIESLIEQMTAEELAMQLDMFQGDLFISNGRLDPNLVEANIKRGMMGVIHDFKAPIHILNQMQSIALSRHSGIPLLVIEECLHGLLIENRTVFPQAIALAATFNVDMVERVGKAIGRQDLIYDL